MARSAVFMPDNFAGVTNFLFPTPVTMTPQVIYYFQPVVQSGDQWNADRGGYDYRGGMAFFKGVAGSASDLWFREGIVVPEPSAAVLGLLGGALLLGRRRATFS